MTYMTFGTPTFQAEPIKLAKIGNVMFQGDEVVLALTDGRAIHLDMTRFAWLRNADAEQRNRWEIVPSGGGVWWPKLDEGIELQPLLDLHALA